MTRRDSRYRVDAKGCWIWTGPINTDGQYGKRGSYGAHRVAYVRLGGRSIPEGYEVDHLCRVPLCINPDHLEAVTPEENRRRKYAAIVACKHGHPYDEANTYTRPSGRRDCRCCIRARVAAYYQRRRGAA